MKLIGLSCGEFAAKLASKDAVPGGGGASALAGALAAALGSMVGELTIGKKKYENVQDDLLRLGERAAALREELLSLVDGDAEAFLPLSKAYGIPKGTPGRDELLENCLKDAAAVPFRVMELCEETLTLLSEYAEKGSRLAVSDAATGAALAEGALRGAYINVRVNTALMKDREYAAALEERCRELLGRALPAAGGIFESVDRGIG